MKIHSLFVRHQKNILNNSPPNGAVEVVDENQKLDDLMNRTGRVLLKIKAIFPFDFFPNTVIVDESKVIIVFKQFFSAERIQTIPISHMQDVQVDTSLLFATLRILPVGFSENWVSIGYLWKHDAVRAQKIINGLLLGVEEGISFEKVQTHNFAQKIERLGGSANG